MPRHATTTRPRQLQTTTHEFPGDECDDEDPTTINDALNDDCECVGIVDGIAEATLDFGMFPNPTREVTLSMVGFHTGGPFR